MNKESYVYIMTNRHNTVLYTGVTSDLVRRIYQHKNNEVDGFTKKYNVDKLVYFETYSTIEDAIEREKLIKKKKRVKKEKLIESMNSEWDDLYSKFIRE